MTLLVTLLAITTLTTAPPDSISLEYCYDSVRQNYPTEKKVELQNKITELNRSIAHTGYFPELTVGARASYQSEVTEVAIPGMNSSGASQDQYEASISVTQNIFNGGAVGIQKNIARAQGQANVHSVEVEMHQIRSQVNHVYFGINNLITELSALFVERLRCILRPAASIFKSGVFFRISLYICFPMDAYLVITGVDSIRNGFNS